VSENLSQGYNYVRNSLNSFLNRSQTALAQLNLQNKDISYTVLAIFQLGKLMEQHLLGNS